MKNKKVIVFGGGRMGLSHASMLSLLDPNIEIIIVEPSFKTRMLLKVIVGEGIRVKKEADDVDVFSATHAVIATPPMVHSINCARLSRGRFSGRLLVEKPISVKVAALSHFHSAMSGYVLRKAFFWKKLVSDIDGKRVLSIRFVLETNQDFGVSSGEWRVSDTTPGLSLLSEFGSHCINLLIGIVPGVQLELKVIETNRVELASKPSDKISSNIELIANSKNVRKSVYKLTLVLEDSVLETDFYSYSEWSNDGSVVQETTLASEGIRSRAYVRGHEFAEQASIFLADGDQDNRDIHDAILTDSILEKLQGELKFQR
jgi:hypothetical protein